MKCCDEKPVFTLIAGERLCKDHFIEYFENKVFKTIRQFQLLEKEENLGVALSGGKDSLAVLNILKKLSVQNPKIKINAIAIDEGIDGYREKTLKKADEFCKENGIALHVFSYKQEFGFTLDEILKKLDVKPCSICGVFRRYLLNRKSHELKLTKLATGHNLDDECQSVMMNQFKSSIRASARLGPKVGIESNEKFVQRIKPLYLCPEKEVMTYAFVNGLLDGFTECPNAVQSYRAQIRDMLNDMEQKFPGTKYSVINSFLELLPLLKRQYTGEMISLCPRCSEPSSNGICSACVYLERLGAEVIDKIN